MDEFKRENYIYLRFIVDTEHYKKGDILRLQKDYLIHKLKGRRFGCFSEESLIWEKNPDAGENEIDFSKLYKSVTVNKDYQGRVYLWEDDYLCLDEWLFSHLSSCDIDLVKRLKSESIANEKNLNIIRLKEGCPDVNSIITLYFEKGEQLDFSHPSIATLFYDPYWLKVFTETEVIEGKEKEKLFQEDFSNAIFVPQISDAEYSPSYCQEHHYFKVKENIQVKTEKEVANLLGLSYLSNIEGVKDKQGFITHLCSVTPFDDNSDRFDEQLCLRIADRINGEEALEVHKQASLDYLKKQKEEMVKWQAKRAEEKRILDEKYQKIKDDYCLFPGIHGKFVHVHGKEKTNQKYTLKEIKNFYQNLKNLDSEIVSHLCFYGGTVPYILNNATESRDFGDIDLFVPIQYMEKVRIEFLKQDSFEMIKDSKPLAEDWMLTTRIKKESTELALKNNENEFESVASSFAEVLAKWMTPIDQERDYMDDNGIVHNIFNAYREEQLPYYRKIQDFGFKAKLFGVSISVFPLYEYEQGLMAKSFNINENRQILLGVRVLENTQLNEFIKPIHYADSTFNILPLEYTLISKQSAVDEKYAYRYEKDKVDVKYILSHKKELGIKEERIEEILKNYPDYSISIAYEWNGREVVTMGGEEYKKRVLTKNRQVS